VANFLGHPVYAV